MNNIYDNVKRQAEAIISSQEKKPTERMEENTTAYQNLSEEDGRQKVKDMEQDRVERSEYASSIFGIIYAFIALVLILIAASMPLSPVTTVAIILLTANIAKVFGIFLFPRR